jgi:hypothetical protein
LTITLTADSDQVLSIGSVTATNLTITGGDGNDSLVLYGAIRTTGDLDIAHGGTVTFDGAKVDVASGRASLWAAIKVTGGITVTQADGMVLLTNQYRPNVPEESDHGDLLRGIPIWAQVDVFNPSTNHGNVLESVEGNNVFGPILSTAGARSSKSTPP